MKDYRDKIIIKYSLTTCST